MQPTRRELLKAGLGGLGVVSIGASVPSFVAQMARAETPATQPGSAAARDNVLVVVQFSGGNDGLNTVLPHGNDAYLKARPSIAIKNRYHELDDTLALNPGLKAFKALFDAGQLAIVNGCGYPQPNRSHFRSMEIWHTASPSRPQPGGWLGHYLDHFLRGSDNPVQAINIGPQLPQALRAGGAPVPSIQSLNDYSLRDDRQTPGDSDLEQKIIKDLSAVRDGSPALNFLARQATNAILSAEQIHHLASKYKADAEYPQELGVSLRLIAQLLSANLGTRIFYCQIGGFDTHSNQPGNHERLLANVADSIAAFHADMTAKGLNDKVTLMCFSEFGRRVAENNSHGTDHGAAGPMFISGGRVKGGLHGSYPTLTDLDDGDLKYTTDFRCVYAAVLENWLGADSATVLGSKFQPTAVL